MKSALPFVLSIALLLGCSDVRVLSTWKAGGVASDEYRTIQVNGFSGEEVKSVTQLIQDHVAEDLQHLGYYVITHDAIPIDIRTHRLVEAALIDSLRGTQADAVITIVLIENETGLRLIPNNLNYYVPQDLYAYGYWGYPGDIFDQIHDPGRFVMQSKYLWKGSMLDVHTKKLIFSSTIRAYDYVDPRIMAHACSRVLVQKMVKERILKQKEAPARLPF